MKIHPLGVFLVLACLNAGCSWIEYTDRNTVEAPLRALDDRHAQRRFAELAREAWLHVLQTHPGQCYSPDYVCGFLAGFADYLDLGGNGEPPAAPPDRYLCSKYETPQGQEAIHDWFAGFRHGASVARDSGLRELVVLPISQPPRSSDNVASANATPPTAQVPTADPQEPPTGPPVIPPPPVAVSPHWLLPPAALPAPPPPAPVQLPALPPPAPKQLPELPPPTQLAPPAELPPPSTVPYPMPKILSPVPPLPPARLGFEDR